MKPPRIGHGFDAHRLVKGRPLILGGVKIPYARGLTGHSDADALIHAIVDALLGALGLGDIGAHFPSTDPAYKDMSSLKFLEQAKALLDEKGYAVANVDSTIIAEEPRIAPHIAKMKTNIARILEIPEGATNIKAATTEGMGYTGNKEGIAVHAVALVLEKEELIPW